MQTRIKSVFCDDFHRALIALVIPIAVQNLISAAVVSADVLMLGLVSQTAMSAVSLAGQVSFVLTLFYMGLATGAGVLTAQYWGKKDVRTIQKVFNIAMMFSFCISLVFFVLSLSFPAMLMRLFTNDAALIGYGARYLRWVSLSFLVMGLSQMYLSVAKSTENARLSAWITSTCLVLNIMLNALCIFVLFPDNPERAIIGVALSTVTARFVELVWCMAHSARSGHVRFRLPGKGYLERSLLGDYLKYTSPVQANYIVWGGALAAVSAIIGHVSADMVAANSIAGVVKNLATVLCAGIAGGGSVLVGKYLGNNDKAMARKAGDRMILYSLISGALAGLTILLLKPLVFQLVNLSDAAQVYLNGMLYVCAFYCIGKSMNSTVIGGIFCAGGDAKFGFICDTVVMWGIILPLGYLCAFVWQLPPVLLYAVLSMDEFVKLPAAVVRYRKYRWLTNITRDFA